MAHVKNSEENSVARTVSEGRVQEVKVEVKSKRWKGGMERTLTTALNEGEATKGL